MDEHCMFYTIISQKPFFIGLFSVCFASVFKHMLYLFLLMDIK